MAVPVDAIPPTTEPLLATVVGMSQAKVRSLLGEPASTGETGPSQTWTYHAAACSLVVGFFFDVTRGAFFALTAHAEPPPEADCLARLRGASHAS